MWTQLGRVSGHKPEIRISKLETNPKLKGSDAQNGEESLAF